jgi:signal recognition particle receptor subunit beta
MAWYDQDSLFTWAFAPNYSTILLTLIVAIGLPILVHIIFYRASTRAGPPRFVLLGPSGSGKTTLVAKVGCFKHVSNESTC